MKCLSDCMKKEIVDQNIDMCYHSSNDMKRGAYLWKEQCVNYLLE